MNIFLNKIPYLKDNMSISSSVQLDDISLIIIYKTIFRDDDSVIIDVYLNDISETTKIFSGKRLSKDALIYSPQNISNFNYYIYCQDCDGIEQELTKNNANKFYLQFVSTSDVNDFDKE